MKKVFLLAIVATMSLAACQKQKTAPILTKQSAQEDVTYKAILEDLSYFAGLYDQGDLMTLSIVNGQVEQSLSKTKSSFNVLSEKKHDYSSTNKIKFAEWCNKELKAGHTLEIGYDKDTKTYWADITS